jgi:outer membrane protein TolC
VSLFAPPRPLLFRFRSFKDGTWLAVFCAGALLAVSTAGCTARQKRAAVDKRTAAIIADKQTAALGAPAAFTILPPEETLRRRLLTEQDLAYISPTSLGSEFLESPKGTPEAQPARSVDSLKTPDRPPLPSPFSISLNESLQIAAANSRTYQSRKESVFRTALALDLEREDFRTSFSGLVSTLFRHDRTDRETGGPITEEQETSAVLAASKTLKTGGELTLRIGLDLLKLLRPGDFSSQAFFGDASVNIPLLRGAGRRIAAESLTQAERDALYAIYDFEEFKRGFAVGIARQYLSVLQNEDRVRNAEENYRSLITASRRSRRLLQAGSLPPIQVDQALQNELRARNRWISAQATFDSSVDNFKLQLGLPVDAVVTLQRAEFDALYTSAASNSDAVPPAITVTEESQIPAADSPVTLASESPAPPGPLEIPYDDALQLAFTHRLDMKIAEGRVVDAQRAVVVGADGFNPALNLQLRGTTEDEKLRGLDADHGNYSAALLLDLPLNRTREAIAYRQNLIALQAAVRGVQDLEDNIKLAIRSRLRALREARESLHIQTLSLQLARRRVRGADLNLQAGRVPIRDLLDAQEDLLSAQNAVASAAINYRLGELDLQRDLGILVITPDGLWREFTPPPSSP